MGALNSWWLLAAAAIVALSLALYFAQPATVYLVHGDVWRCPRRVGINDDGDWDRHHFRRCGNWACWSRVCKYKHGRDSGARSWLWAHEVDWSARPKLWLWCFTVRRRHRVLYVPCPTRGVAKWAERKLIRHYAPTFNVQHVPPTELARRRRERAKSA